jgi:hydrogenase maturation factor
MIDHCNKQPQNKFEKIIKTRDVSHRGLPIYIKKSILKQKKNYKKTKYFHHAEI